MRGHNTFSCRINKKYPELSPNTPSYLELCSFLERKMVEGKFMTEKHTVRFFFLKKKKGTRGMQGVFFPATRFLSQIPIE